MTVSVGATGRFHLNLIPYESQLETRLDTDSETLGWCIGCITRKCTRLQRGHSAPLTVGNLWPGEADRSSTTKKIDPLLYHPSNSSFSYLSKPETFQYTVYIQTIL